MNGFSKGNKKPNKLNTRSDELPDTEELPAAPSGHSVAPITHGTKPSRSGGWRITIIAIAAILVALIIAIVASVATIVIYLHIH